MPKTDSNQNMILIVDDTPTNLATLSQLLKQAGLKVLVSQDGESAIRVLEQVTPDLILLDVMMPGIDGFETYKRIKSNSLTSHIPVIFISALSELGDKLKGLSLGAVDYITKPFYKDEILARVNTHLEVRRLTKRLEEQNLLLEKRVTERTAALSQVLQNFQLLVNFVPVGIFQTDADGNCLFANTRWLELAGMSIQEALGQGWSNAVHFDDRQRVFAEWYNATQKGQEFIMEYRFQTSQGKVTWLSGRGVPMRDSSGNITGYLGTVTDISDRKLTESALQQAVIAADAANHAKSEFLASMSHELRTPLNAILGFTQVMGCDRTLSPQQQENLSIINHAGEHLLSLINDILEMSKIEAGRTVLHPGRFDLIHLLSALEEMLKFKAKSQGLQLIFEIAKDLPQYIETDEGKLRQVLINIVGNAIKFTKKGSVTLRASLANSFNKKTQFGSEAMTIKFEIEDTGSGIAPEEINRLFQPFTQTETGQKFQEGTGLGLAISQKFVQLMGGDIQVKSILGQGSLFAFHIQVKTAEAVDKKTTQLCLPVIGLAPNQPQYRILIVDDIRESRLFLVTLLTSIGFQVNEASNGQQAVALWSSWQPHLICMDMRMPMMGGSEATKQIRAKEQQMAIDNRQSPMPKTVIIALTANAFDEDRNRALSAGCDDFISKPLRQDMLLEKVSRYLGVVYLYEENENPNINSKKYDEILTPTELKYYLSQMPVEWISQVHNASYLGCDDKILELLAEVQPENQKFANTLRDLANNFQFDKIIELTQFEDIDA
jgi:PAS domain S-box-containing protein